MGRIKVSAFTTGASTKSGITIALAERSGAQSIRVGLTEAAQKEFFGGPLDPSKDALDIILSDEPGSVHLMGIRLADQDDADAIPIQGGIKGSVSVRLVPWRQVAPGKRPAVALAVVNRKQGQEISVKLPDWARPDARKIGQGRSIMD